MSRTLLITFHPETGLSCGSADSQMVELLSALEQIDAQFIFTMPNADAGGRVIFKLINEFVAANENVLVRTSRLARPLPLCISFVSRCSGELFVRTDRGACIWRRDSKYWESAKWPFKGEQCDRLCFRSEMRLKGLLPLC